MVSSHRVTSLCHGFSGIPGLENIIRRSSILKRLPPRSVYRFKMGSKGQHFSRIGTQDICSQIIKKLGQRRAEKYFSDLKKFLNLKISKLDFDKICRITIGRENIKLHNFFIRSILKNACLSRTPPIRDVNSPHSLISKISNGSFAFTSSPSQGKIRTLNTIDQKLKDRPGARIPSISGSCDIRLPSERKCGPEMISIGSKAPIEIFSVEDGEEVEQVRDSPCVESRSPIRAPLGIPSAAHSLSRKSLSRFLQDTCESCSELPDTLTLQNRMEQKAELHGLRLSEDTANLLNNGLDAYLKRLIKPCIDFSRSRAKNGNLMHKDHEQRLTDQSVTVPLLDFRVTMLSNRKFLGDECSSRLEKISFSSFNE